MSQSSSMLRLAAPLALQQVGSHLMGLVDAAILGRYSDAALAGAGVGNNAYFAITCVGLGIIMGMDSVVPQAVGGGRHDDARRYLRAGVRLGVLVGLLTTLAVMATPSLLALAHVDHAVLAEARPFTYMRALGALPFLLSIAFRSYLSAYAITRPLVISVVVGNVLNAGLDVALIFGVPAIGLPAMGAFGAALATTLVQTLMLGIFIASVRVVDVSSQPPRTPAPSTRADVLAIARHGLPVGGQLLAEVGIFAVATVLAARMGKIPAAAHTIALSLASFTFSFALGIANATSVLVGHAVGASDIPLARKRGFLGFGMGAAVMATFATMFLVLARPLAGMFTHDPTVVAAAASLLQIAAVFQLSDAAQAIGAGALRGLADTRPTLVANVIGHYAVGLPVMLGLGIGAGLGARGLWWGLSAGLTVTAAILVVRFLRSTSRTRP
jgi:MATE family multidrug resistance protein